MSSESSRAQTKGPEKDSSVLDRKEDESIDLSDSPELNDEFWKHAELGKFYKPVKQQLTIRLDADVVDWFKGVHPRYQTAINEVLRKHMLDQRRQSG